MWHAGLFSAIGGASWFFCGPEQGVHVGQPGAESDPRCLGFERSGSAHAKAGLLLFSRGVGNKTTPPPHHSFEQF